jgi:hypothetical protein
MVNSDGQESLSTALRRRRNGVTTHERYPGFGTTTGRIDRQAVDSLGQFCEHPEPSKSLAVPFNGTP